MGVGEWSGVVLGIGSLGDLQVFGRDGLISIGGRRRRALVTFLLLNAGRRVSMDSICEAVWDADPPSGAAATVRTYVSQLRKLGVDGDALTVESDAYGYRLAVDRADVDAASFEDAVATALSLGDSNERLRILDSAADLWLGPPLAEFADTEWGAIEARRLRTIYDRLTTERFEILLRLGRHRECLGQLEAAVTETPLDEHLAGQLALAHYRCGMVADALRDLSGLRHRLADELGLSPGPSVVDLERRMLDRNPDLDLAARDSSRRRRDRVRRRRRFHRIRPTPPDRDGHVPVHRYGGVDAAARSARRRGLRGGTGDAAPAHRGRRRGPRWGGGRLRRRCRVQRVRLGAECGRRSDRCAATPDRRGVACGRADQDRAPHG